MEQSFLYTSETKRLRTYDGEFVESFKELDAEIDVLKVDVGIAEVDELRRLADDVERLDVVRLLAQVILTTTTYSIVVKHKVDETQFRFLVRFPAA